MLYLVGGARPNFMKIAAISRALDKQNIDYEIIHTGQHYDYNMNDVFFKEFNLKDPYIHLEVGSGPHGQQTGRIMEKFERLCIDKKPDMILTVGDVNSTMAASLVAAKLHIFSIHQEAGMRSFDRKMPEEINRIVSDHTSDLLFPISENDEINLYNEGIPKDKVHLVGDVMIDNLLYYTDKIKCSKKNKHILVELHRPANVDPYDNLKEICKGIQQITKAGHKVIFPIHPRTKKMIELYRFWGYLDKVEMIPPVGYFEFLKYIKNATSVLTDSDGLQQETSILNIPCIAIRDTSNIAYTIEYGTTILCPVDSKEIYNLTLSNKKRQCFPDHIKKLNDGKAAERMVKIINEIC